MKALIIISFISCVAGFGLWEGDDFPVARYLDSTLVDFVLNDADTIYSEIYRRDAAMTFYRAYESDTAWAGVAGASALYDSLFTTDAGRICRAEVAYKLSSAECSVVVKRKMFFRLEHR